MTDELSEDEKGLVACAIAHPGFPPKPEYLPDCERLRERGWLDRRMVDSLATYWLSEAGATAFEMSAMTTLEPGQQN